MNDTTVTETILEEREVFRGRKFRVLERDIRLTDEHVATWEVLDKGWDSVAMVPLDHEGNVHLVREYFGATNERAICLPKGKIDPGEDADAAAGRELREEIGCGGTLTRLGTLSVSPGYLTQRTILFLARDLYEEHLEGDEVQFIQPTVIPLTTALTMCMNGQITESRTIAGLFMAARYVEAEGRAYVHRTPGADND